MLTREENEFLCRTDKGTPMGEFCRRFWTPVLLSEEIPGAGLPPVQSKIYGEELVVFRTTSGKVGVLKEFCPHRRAASSTAAMRRRACAAPTTAGSSTSRATASI